LISKREISETTLLRIVDYVYKAAKERRSKDQIVTNVYLILDRRFEQSVKKGLRDSKNGSRVKRVPRGSNPVEFLRNLADNEQRKIGARHGSIKHTKSLSL